MSIFGIVIYKIGQKIPDYAQKPTTKKHSDIINTNNTYSLYGYFREDLFMKKKSLTMLLTSLLAVSLTGVGFASWIIVQGDEEQLNDGTVSVETIDRKNVTVTALWADNDEDNIWLGGTEPNNVVDADDSQLSFGTSNNANTGWLRNTDGKVERKSLNLDVAVANHTYATGIKVTFTISDAAKYKTLVSEGYITGFMLNEEAIPTDSDENVTAGTLVKTFDSAATLDLTISYGWGTTKFGGENPYVHYNKISAPTEEQITEAYNTITALHTNLNGVTFSLTIESLV